MEQFFLESLEHVKSEISKTKSEKENPSFFLTQVQEEAVLSHAKGATRFPSIRKGEDSSQLPSMQGRIDIKDLSWEDKERVLRLLFAKINQLNMCSFNLQANMRRPAPLSVPAHSHLDTAPSVEEEESPNEFENALENARKVLRESEVVRTHSPHVSHMKHL